MSHNQTGSRPNPLKRAFCPRVGALCLNQIQRLNLSLNACITVSDSFVPAKPTQTEGIISSLENSLRGIPVAVKDMIDTADIKTTERHTRTSAL
ncbi:MAG: hypothetical protein HS124_01350 [Anaerolineales bacterium]|nr:hypothetical protein [Anaerolineales bacterium]